MHPIRCPAAEFGATLLIASAASVFGAFVGESERRLRDTFAKASSLAATGKLVVVFLDEVDALCPRRQGSRPHEARVVAQLLTLLDGAAGLDAPTASTHAHGSDNTGKGGAASPRGRVLVVAATNRPNAVDSALRRPGRLDREVSVSVPDAHQRSAILRCGAGCLCVRCCGWGQGPPLGVLGLGSGAAPGAWAST
jgi:SpoVK/Ycf46/Vps4 family AAA+-type ATPase